MNFFHVKFILSFSGGGSLGLYFQSCFSIFALGDVNLLHIKIMFIQLSIGKGCIVTPTGGKK